MTYSSQRVIRIFCKFSSSFLTSDVPPDPNLRVALQQACALKMPRWYTK